MRLDEERSEEHSNITNNLLPVASLLAIPHPNHFRDSLRSFAEMPAFNRFIPDNFTIVDEKTGSRIGEGWREAREEYIVFLS